MPFIAKTHEKFVEEMAIVNPNIEILDVYQRNDIKIKCKCKLDGHEWLAFPSNLLSGKGCPKCAGHVTKTYDEIIDLLSKINPNVEIISDYENTHTKVLCRCKKDNYIWSAFPTNLLRGSGCPLCANKAVVRGINDIATTAHWMIKYIKYIDDSYKYACQSNKKITFKCPDCGYESEALISNIYKRGFSCKICSDKISYPNKFCRTFLKQLPIENLIPEYRPTWAKQYFYDNYFIYNNQEYILEADGGWHFTDNKLNGKSLKEIQKSDIHKDFLAKEHNIQIIRIDCRKSDKNYIAEKLKESIFNKIFDLSDINWDMCDEKARSNLIKTIADLYNQNISIQTISENVNLKEVTVRTYLRKATKLGFCKYGRYKQHNIERSESN